MSDRAVHSLGHAKTFGEALAAINKGVSRALPSKDLYNKVVVLSLRWKNDDLGRKDIETELLQLFERKYLFKTDSLLIPCATKREAMSAIHMKLRTMRSFDSSDTLFIVVYEGRSDAYYRLPSASLGVMGSVKTAVSVPWSFVESQLATANGGVLFILDTGFPPEAAWGYENFEYLAAASALKPPAAANIDVSLTRQLINLLSQEETGITIAQLYAKLVVHANRPGSQLDHTPVHVAARDRPSITLRRLEALPRKLRGDLSDGKVLVTVWISGRSSVPDVGQWIQWLSTSIPEEVADIKIEGLFKSDSSLLLLIMPVAVWSMLRHNDSFDFVSVVQSHNLLCHQSRPRPNNSSTINPAETSHHNDTNSTSDAGTEETEDDNVNTGDENLNTGDEEANTNQDLHTDRDSDDEEPNTDENNVTMTTPQATTR
ncbi:hypothetical protein ASPBRDRAFT_60657 [Aspergillus brasiliensis CBS 101740]|uniref:Uncharacterized protein n=1 Tax=Aspergillus brasiliensis (strain CBS 101740 / IMI 381727 / IBT 21946) TaxID=767769 RepID=A0A1L9UZ99_ASPBC|nr:hypothetical protein ASPBRDRAFT_60657 [Aspergillus brasiliensis CBS 101740]